MFKHIMFVVNTFSLSQQGLVQGNDKVQNTLKSSFLGFADLLIVISTFKPRTLNSKGIKIVLIHLVPKELFVL